jgi:hypothetical protein
MSEEDIKEKLNKEKDKETPSIILVFISFVLIGWFLVSGVGFFINYMAVVNGTYSIETTDTPIFSLQDGTRATGHFFIGSGSVEGEGYYVYYVSTGPLKHKRVTVKSDYTEIVEDEEESPYIREFVAMETECTISNCRTSPVIFDPNYYMEGWYGGYKKWELHVPNGTLTHDMEVGDA